MRKGVKKRALAKAKNLDAPEAEKSAKVHKIHYGGL